LAKICLQVHKAQQEYHMRTFISTAHTPRHLTAHHIFDIIDTACNRNASDINQAFK